MVDNAELLALTASPRDGIKRLHFCVLFVLEVVRCGMFLVGMGILEGGWGGVLGVWREGSGRGLLVGGGEGRVYGVVVWSGVWGIL